jgi:hypothetical protein
MNKLRGPLIVSTAWLVFIGSSISRVDLFCWKIYRDNSVSSNRAVTLDSEARCSSDQKSALQSRI